MEDTAPPIVAVASIWASMNSWFTPTVLFVFLNLVIGTILFTSNLPNQNRPYKQEDNDKSQNQNQQNDSNQSKIARSPSILHRLRSLNLYTLRSQQDSTPVTHNHQHQEPLEIAATQYVFDHPFPHEQDAVQVQPDSVNPNNFDLNPTHFETFEKVPEAPAAASVTEYSDVKHTNKVRPVNVQTHFIYEPKDTVEKVTAHFNFEPDGPESPEDLGFVETNDGGDEEDDEFNSFDDVYSKITGGNMNRTKSDTIPASGELPVKLPAKMKKSASLKSSFSHFEEENIVEARRPATVRERRSAAMATDADDVEVDAKADDFINKFKHQLKLQRLDSIIRYKDMVSRGSEK